MRKPLGDGRKTFLFGLKKHQKELLRKNKTYLGREVSFEEEYEPIDNPVLNFVKSISSNKELSKRCIRDEKIIIPKTFSLYEQPEVALNFICSVAKVLAVGKKKSYTIDYSNTRSYCLGAECLLGLAVKEARLLSSQNNGSVPQIHGVYPKNSQHLEIIREVGVVKDMSDDNSHTIQDFTRDDKKKQKRRIFREESIGKEDPSAFAKDKKNSTAESFSKYINQCLLDHRLELKEEANDFLTSCMGELLDNAERHCGLTQRSRWYVRGYVNNSDKNPMCELSVFNFGKTIAETFNELPKDHYSLTKQVKPYVARHLSKPGMFEEGLVTVAALQGRVSCKNILETDSCGTGTIELLKFFQDMIDEIERMRGRGKKPPKMSLISGKCHLSFDGRYPLNKRLVNDGDSEFYTYPFNMEGLEKEPDRAYLRTMSGARFPGVMINIRFPLQKTVSI
ncbi:hypothetical protein AAF463_23915 (plasmid) [Pantoea sp. BJ2]|uniref:Uncharacterized protein n=1 Tax=Pantoea sp. BJ2 TaxID=3141322 RepID=A0AAU7U3W6_9GAMM